jgi:carbon storage regulator
LLVLSRKRNETIIVTHPDGTRIVVTVVDPRGDKVRIGISAPPDVIIHRAEIQLEIDRDRAEAGRAGGEGR